MFKATYVNLINKDTDNAVKLIDLFNYPNSAYNAGLMTNELVTCQNMAT